MHSVASWEALIERVFQVEQLFCPQCENEIRIFSLESEAQTAEAILRHLENGGGEDPIDETPPAPPEAEEVTAFAPHGAAGEGA